MSADGRRFKVSINRIYPGVKLAIGDRRWAAFNAGFRAEDHTPDSLLAEIMRGCSFCCVLGGCILDHCGRSWCCPERRGDATHCGRPVGYRNAAHFKSAQTLELDFDQGDESSSIAHLITEPFIAGYAGFLYSTLGSVPQAPRSRVIFILEAPITDPAHYRDARIALLHKFPASDQAIKDVARFLYGSNPTSGEFHRV